MNINFNEEKIDFIDIDNIVEYLLDKGLIDDRVIVDGDIEVFDVSRKNRNIKILSKIGHSLFLKQSNPYESNGSFTIKRESLLYAKMQTDNEFAALADIAPKIKDYDEKRNIMITEFVPGYSWNQYVLRDPKMELDKDLLKALGKLIANYHHVFERILVNKKLNFLPKTFTFEKLLIHPGPDVFASLSGANMKLLRIIQQDPIVYEILEELFASWTTKTLIHGDIKFDNIIITSQGNGDKIIVTDWEMANIGDPAWDIGSIFQEFIRSWLYTLPLIGTETPEQLLNLSSETLKNMQSALRTFWNEYIHVIEKGIENTNELLTRSTKYCAARLIQSAYEMLHSQSELNNMSVYMVQIGLNILGNVNKATIHLLGIPFKIEL